jgi:predicted dehydrogenase
MAKKLALGFVGAGYMGQLAHIANYADLPDVTLAALAEGREKTAQLVARRYGIETVYPSHREMLAEAKVDAVVAILPYRFHHAVIPDILGASKHCLTEKPIAIRAETGRRLAQLARERGLVYQVGYMKRSDLASQYAWRLIRQWQASGEFGRLRYVRVEMPPGDWQLQSSGPLTASPESPAYEGQSPEPFPAWMDEETGKFYDRFINYYVHQLNLLRFLLGEDYDVRYADPAGVTMTASTATGVTVTLEMAAYQCRDHWEEAYTFCFGKGYVRLELPAPMARQRAGRVLIYRGAGEVTAFEEPVFKSRWAMQEQARFFIESVRDGSPNVSPAEDAAKDMEVAEQYVRLFLASGKP